MSKMKKLRQNRYQNRYNYYSSNGLIGASQIDITQHALQRYKLRSRTNRNEEQLKLEIRNAVSIGRLIYISKTGEEHILYNKNIYVCKKDKYNPNKRVVVTVLLNKDAQRERFSDQYGNIDYFSMGIKQQYCY